VIDLDIQKFFDSVRWDLIVKGCSGASTPRGWCCMPSGGRERR
jgi:hypothetical protein